MTKHAGAGEHHGRMKGSGYAGKSPEAQEPFNSTRSAQRDSSDLDFEENWSATSFSPAVKSTPLRAPEEVTEHHDGTRAASPPDVELYEARPEPPRGRRQPNSPTLGRLLPHSLEAEEMLLSCCLIDGSEVMGKALRARIGVESFYDPKHGMIFECLVELYHRNAKIIDIGVLAEELKTQGKINQVGGFPFLAQVSSRAPTTAQAEFFIGKVREQAVLRGIIRQATSAVEDCYGFSGGIEEFADELRNKVTRAIDQAHAPDAMDPRPLTSFELPPEDDPAAMLGRSRYIGRGDGALIVSSSGMGKSVMCYEWPALAAMGKPFLGIETKRPLKSLVIQAEDADGDIGEVMFSIQHMLKPTPDELEAITRNVIVVREKVHRGAAFISRLRVLVAKVKPDLVWLNPLHAFAGCDIADAAEMSNFLRGGLNGVNKDDQFAYMIIHHTPKPLTGKGVVDKKWSEFMYDAAGSAELVNWARAVLTIKPTDTEGEFNLVLAKRGKRAGVRVVAADSEAGNRVEITTKIPIKHSSEQVKIPGRAEPFYVLHWEPRAPDAPSVSGPKVKEGRPAKYSFESYRSAFQLLFSGTENRANFSRLHKAAHGIDGISLTQLRDLLRAAVKQGDMTQAEDGRYYVSVPGV